MQSKWAHLEKEVLELINKGDDNYREIADKILSNANAQDNSSFRKFIKRRMENPLEVTSKTVTTTKDYSDKPKFVLSAWSELTGGMMDINEYCEHYNLPRKDISSYKLISHTGTPYYNIVFKERIDLDEVDLEDIKDFITELISDDSKPIEKVKIPTVSIADRLVYTDTHIAMSTDIEGTAMYATPWNRSAVLSSLYDMCQEVISTQESDILYIDELGDFLDGWDGYTTRGGHKLPQNMNNVEAFKLGLKFKIDMIRELIPHYKHITCNNVCNDNHSGDFSAILNHAFKEYIDSKYDNVTVINYNKFIDHYLIGNRAIVLTHGKDKKSLKFGFKPQLDSKQIEKIDHYLKHNSKGNVFREADYIQFCKGDSHQFLFDWTTAQDFDYFNYPALSPSSEWVQSNFKKGIRGFVIEHIKVGRNRVKFDPIFL